MIKERLNHGLDSLINAIEVVETEGYTTQFVCTEKGFLAPENGQTYLPECTCEMEYFFIDTPYSEPDAQSVIYLLETVDGKKGWITGQAIQSL